MARGGINKAQVHTARAALIARGLNPSIDLVRVELGNTGSKSTIQRYLKELSDAPKPESHPATPTEEMLSLVNSLAERLSEQAQESVAEERQRLDRQQAGQAHECAQLRERLEQSLSTITQLTNDMGQQRLDESQLREQLQDSDSDRKRLHQVVSGLQQMLDERAKRLQSLEEELQHAWEALEHYRREQQAQRGQELRRHDEQTQQLQQELRGLQNAQLAKQEELVNVYREHERVLNECRGQQEQIRQHAKVMRDAQRTQDLLNTQVQQMVTERAVLRDRVKPYALELRKDRRQLRDQARQIETLQTLLRDLTPTV